MLSNNSLPTRDSYGLLHNIADRQQSRINRLLATAKIPERYDTISFDRKSRADGSAVHHEVYDYTSSAVIICVRATEGSRYGVRTVSKQYYLITGTETRPISSVAALARRKQTQPGDIINHITGKKRIAGPAQQTWIAYKSVALRPDGTLASIFDNNTSYTIGHTYSQAVRPDHEGGYYVYPTASEAQTVTVPDDSDNKHLPRVLVQVECRGRRIRYGNKIATTSIKILRRLDDRALLIELWQSR